MCAIATDAVAAGRPAAAAKEVELITKLAATPQVAGDGARLAQVLDNLISNAVKFTPAGGRVTVSTCATAREVEVTVSDTGMGIPEHELPRPLQRFFRTEHATAAAVPGTGLGLAIAKAIVEGHDGRLAVESEDGAGTTFRVYLPVE